MQCAPVIELHSLCKAYADFSALSAITLKISRGEVFGLLGPNGAGKTTTLRILMGLLRPTSGNATILGMDCFVDRVALKRRTGYLSDAPFFYEYLKGWELLRFVGEMHGLDNAVLGRRAEQLLEELQLVDVSDDYVTNYSLGMKKKMGLALALIHEPSVLILDEPTTGLDPLASRHIRHFIRSYAARGNVVLLSTHWLEMAESLCDRLGIIHKGRLAATGTPTELHAKLDDPAQGQTSLEDIFVKLTSERAIPQGA